MSWCCWRICCRGAYPEIGVGKEEISLGVAGGYAVVELTLRSVLERKR